MNRRERRQMSKNLGIMEYQRKLPRNKKFELIRENIIAGKQIHQEFVEKSRIAINEQSEQTESQVVYNMAEDIAKRKKIPVIDAMDEAQKQYDKRKR